MDRWYSYWLEKDLFTADLKDAQDLFSVFIVPPNVTGSLHLGHALMIAIQDLWLRWHRMQGRSIFCPPGLDHAGIATQYLVEQKLAIPGGARKSLGRERFLQEVWKWVAECRPQIEKTFADLGLSCDWTYLTFTLDPHYCRAVATAFARLFKAGLIYQGDYAVNWCSSCQSALSDLEVSVENRSLLTYSVNFPIVSSHASITVNLLYPELLGGVMAIAVHPDDTRFQQFHGAQVLNPLLERSIPLIIEPDIDMKSGTGAIPVIPGHTHGHEILARKHNLEVFNVIDETGRLNEHAGHFAFLEAEASRQPIIDHLRARGLTVQQHVTAGPVYLCSRCNSEIQLRVAKNWFIKMKPLALPIIDMIEREIIRFEPPIAKQISLQWLRNLHDWCISRQIWWGHPVPIATCSTCHTPVLTTEAVERCPSCGDTSLEPSTDVLDTWFSSSLWHFALLGWPDHSPAFDAFYPVSVIETGRDILAFWVLRMMMLGYRLIGQPPSYKVYLHGLVCDEYGRKMSKVLGNVISVSDILESHGADVLRYVLLKHNRAGQDIRLTAHDFDIDSQMVRRLKDLFDALNELPRGTTSKQQSIPPANTRFLTSWIYSGLADTTNHVTTCLEHNATSSAACRLDDFLTTFRRHYLPLVRFETRRARPRVYAELQTMGFEAFLCLLKLVHPFMPFITEELWHRFPAELREADSILEAKWPRGLKRNPEAEAHGALLVTIIDTIRQSLGNAAIDAYHQAPGTLMAPSDWEDGLSNYLDYIGAETGVAPLHIWKRGERSQDECWIVSLSYPTDVMISIDRPPDSYRIQEVVDVRHRMKRLRDEARRCRDRLNMPAFQQRAPRATIETERMRLSRLYAYYRILEGNAKLLTRQLGDQLVR